MDIAKFAPVLVTVALLSTNASGGDFTLESIDVRANVAYAAGTSQSLEFDLASPICTDFAARVREQLAKEQPRTGAPRIEVSNIPVKATLRTLEPNHYESRAFGGQRQLECYSPSNGEAAYARIGLVKN